MRNVALLLGVAAVLAAAVVLPLWLTRSGGGGMAAASPGAARPIARPQGGARPGLSAPAAAAAADAPESRRVEAGAPPPKVRLGAETARVAPTGTQDGPELTGRVLGLYAAGVADAEVTLKAVGTGSDGILQFLAGSTDQEARTDAAGRFRAPLPDGWEEVQVEIEVRGYLPFSERVDLLDRGGDQDLGTFQLEPGVVLGGRVVSADGDPVPGAEVLTIDEDDNEWEVRFRDDGVETDADGRFELAAIPPGSYLLLVRHDLHPNQRFPGETPPAGGEDLGLVLALKPAVTIAGRIDGMPPGRERVQVVAEPYDSDGTEVRMFDFGLPGGPTAEVAADGTFLLQGLEAGRRYKVRAIAREGFMDATSRSDERIAWADGSEVVLEWDAGATLRLRAVDARTSNPVDDVDVRFRWDGGKSGFNMTKKRSFPGGEVELTELYPSEGATLELQVSAPGYLDLRREGVAVPEGGEVDLGTVRLQPAPTLRVVVVDEDGEPVSGARVRLEPEGEEAESRDSLGWLSLQMRDSTGRTGDDGTCELAAPATPTARLSVTHPRRADYARPGLPMPSHGEREETVRLGEGGTVTVVVVDGAGEPVRGADVLHRYPPDLTDDEGRHETNRRGEVRLRRQTPGQHAFRVAPNDAGPSAPEGDEAWQDVAVADGADVEIVLRVAVRGTLSGRISEGGRPLGRANVSLVSAETPSGPKGLQAFESALHGPDRTDAEGRYGIEDIPAGRYRLRVAHSDRAAPHLVPIEIKGGANRADLDLPLTAIEGRVTDGRGAPIARAQVRLVAPPADGKAQDGGEMAAALRLFQRQLAGGNGTSTGEDGGFRLVGVPAGEAVCVEAEADGFVRGRSQPVTVALGELMTKVEVALERGATLRVRVGGSVGFAWVQASWDGPKEDAPGDESAFVNGGEAVLNGLKPGPWRVSLLGEEGPGTKVEVPKEGEVVLDLGS